MSLSVSHLSFSYGSRQVLSDVSFDLQEGEFLSVLGPNGVGKSTLFRCILGLLDGYKGSITSGGDDVRTLPRRELARRIAYIPQIHAPAFGYTALAMVLMGTARQISAFSRPGREQIAAAMAALERVGAAHLAERDFTRLSGGEQQLVLIARALAQQAGVLVMDEPTSALDYGNQLRVLQLVRELAGEGYAVLLSTHHPQHALSFATRILALSGGRVAAMGEPEAVLTEELMAQLYGVRTEFADTAGGRVLVPVTAEARG
ncbi:MAG: ABC transporter ATP-binding protein [Clostridia bacterium]|nr:ABC transporter ATP-binding protein [Clostridia bacterium]